MNKIISVVIVLVVLVGGFLIFKNKSTAPTETEVENNTPVVEINTEVNVVAGESTVKEFTVDASSYKFSPSTMTVNVGDTVKITVKNVGGIHDLKIDEFSAATRKLNSGESETITFVANKAGSFEYYCSIGTHRQMGMVGTLTVK
ncbi:MAG: cupredoxin domain-containing protein [Minisyncoccia bacterium]